MSKEKTLPKAPTIGDIFDQLPDEMKDKVTEWFLEWIAQAASEVDDVPSLGALYTLVKYHSKDLDKTIEWAIKPEFRHLKSIVVRFLSG